MCAMYLGEFLCVRLPCLGPPREGLAVNSGFFETALGKCTVRSCSVLDLNYFVGVREEMKRGEEAGLQLVISVKALLDTSKPHLISWRFFHGVRSFLFLSPGGFTEDFMQIFLSASVCGSVMWCGRCGHTQPNTTEILHLNHRTGISTNHFNRPAHNFATVILTILSPRCRSLNGCNDPPFSLPSWPCPNYHLSAFQFYCPTNFSPTNLPVPRSSDLPLHLTTLPPFYPALFSFVKMPPNSLTETYRR